jgi:hypothetical protein
VLREASAAARRRTFRGLAPPTTMARRVHYGSGMMTTAATTTNRMNAIVDRQRASRLRDLLFAGLLAIGFGLSLGALRNAAADAGAAPLASAATVTTVAAS